MKKRSAILKGRRALCLLLALVMTVSLAQTSLSASTARAEEAAPALSDYLVAKYDFEDPADPGKDSSGNGNHAQVFGTVSTAVGGIRGDAGLFSSPNRGNSEAYLAMPTDVVKQSQITLMTWVKYDQADAAAFSRIFAIEEAPGGKAFHNMAHAFGEMYYVAEMFNGSQIQISDLPIGVTNKDYNNFWHHVAITFDGNSIGLYVDGELINAQPATDDLSTWNVVGAFIGKTGVWGDSTYHGYMDDFRVYNKALTGQQIKEVNNMTASDFLRAHYTFEDADNLAADTGRYGLHGVINNNVSLNENSIRGNAAQFHTETNDYIQVPVSAVKGKEITVSTWVKTDQEFDGNYLRVFSAERDWNTDNLVLFSKSARTYNGFEAYMQKDGGATFMPVTPEGYPNGTVHAKDGVWQHVAMTVKGNEMKLYINGELATQTTAGNLLCQLDPVNALIGSTFLYGDPSYNGLMDDFRIYGKALSAEEIATENNFTPEDFLFVNYNFDDTETPTKDASGYGFDAVVGADSYGQFSTVEGISGSAGYLDGGTYLEMPEAILVGCQGLTISTWAKFDELPKEFTHLFHFDWKPQTDNSFWLSMAGNSNGMSAGAVIWGWDNVPVVETGAAPKLHEWVHIAYTLREDAVAIYLNGIKVGEGSFDKDAADLYRSNANYIGRAFDWNPMLQATIDEFKMYARVLSEAEILALAGDPTEAKGLNWLKVNGQQVSGFDPFASDYYQVLEAGTTVVPEVTAQAAAVGATVTVIPAESLPGTTYIQIKYANGTQVNVNVHFSLASDNALQHPALSDVTINDTFWSPKLSLFNRVTAPYVLRSWAEKTHDNMGNFKKVAAGHRNTKDYVGTMTWGECDFYASIAGASRLLQQLPNEELAAVLKEYVDIICEASESVESGYFGIYNLLMTDGLTWDQTSHNNPQTLDHLNMAMLLEAGIAYYQATGDARLLRAGIRFLNHGVEYSNHGEKNFISYHGGCEYVIVALCDFLKAYPEVKSNEALADLNINENDYLEFVKNELANHGNSDGRASGHTNYNAYDNDHLSYTELHTAAGHAVSGNLYYTGLAEYGRTSGELEFVNAALRIWENITGKQMYVTGGTGSVHGYEGYGGDYNLPNDGYCESCATGALAQISDSLFLSLAEGKFQDNFELDIYNNLLGSIGANGNTFFYQNPMNTSSTDRWSWHAVACCTKYGLMIYGNLPRYIYAYASNDVYANQYIGSTANIKLDAGTVKLVQEADWAFGGTAKITVAEGAQYMSSLRMRLPEWSEKTVIKVNGETVSYENINGYAVLERPWADGDTVEIIADMTPQRVYANENVESNVDRVALKRGPLVYCLEEVDNTTQTHGNVGPSTILEPSVQITETKLDDLYGGVIALQAQAKYMDFRGQAHEYTMTAVPFFARANREIGSVTTWIAETAAVAEIPRMDMSGMLTWASSNSDTGATAHAAVDGNSDGTRWCASGPSFPQTLLVDLGTISDIAKVNTVFEQVGNWKYRIYYSNDAMKWQEYANRLESTDRQQSYTDEKAVSARYIAIEITDGGLDTNNQACWASIWEFEIIEQGTGVNLALNKACAATSTSWVGASPLAALDYQSNTRWCASDEGLPQQMMVDLGSVADLMKLHLKFEQISDWNFTIETSLDGEIWTVYASETQNGQVFDYENATKARYVRITINGTSGGAWASIWEFDIYTEVLPYSILENFKILEDEPVDPNPDTSDTTHVVLFAVLALISFGALLILHNRKKSLSK